MRSGFDDDEWLNGNAIAQFSAGVNDGAWMNARRKFYGRWCELGNNLLEGFCRI